MEYSREIAAFIMGLFIGAPIGIFIVSMLIMANRTESEEEESR